MEVVAYDPFVSEAVGRELGVTLLDLDDLLPQVDYLSLHTSYTPDTERSLTPQRLPR